MTESCLPRLGVGAIVRHQDAVLLVKRAKPPYAGEWAIPGGKVAAGETLAEAAEREIREETGVTVRAGELAYHFEYIERDELGALRYHYVVLDYYADYLAGEPNAADDALEARWVALDALDALRLNPITLKALRHCYPDAFES